MTWPRRAKQRQKMRTSGRRPAARHRHSQPTRGPRPPLDSSQGSVDWGLLTGRALAGDRIIALCRSTS
jgi:hypothetical protein